MLWINILNKNETYTKSAISINIFYILYLKWAKGVMRRPNQRWITRRGVCVCVCVWGGLHAWLSTGSDRGQDVLEDARYPATQPGQRAARLLTPGKRARRILIAVLTFCCQSRSVTLGCEQVWGVGRTHTQSLQAATLRPGVSQFH